MAEQYCLFFRFVGSCSAMNRSNKLEYDTNLGSYSIAIASTLPSPEQIDLYVANLLGLEAPV